MADRGLRHRLEDRLDQIAAKGLKRRLAPVDQVHGSRISVAGSTFLNLAGNDYLGLAGDRGLVDRFYRQALADPEGLRPGAAASRLMTGNHALYARLEKGLAELYGRQRALVFNSGYHLNIGLLPALTTRHDLILADKLCHASLIDGMRLSRARTIRYPHLDYDRLEELLAGTREAYDQVFLVTESIFSMDGDLADLAVLVRLAATYQAVLYVDEAHAVGVLGGQGLGLAEELGVLGEIDLLVGTFGKAWAGQGAFLLCSRVVADYLVNTARSLIYTTGLPPVTLHWLCFVMERIKGMDRERRHLRGLAGRLRSALQKEGLTTKGASQIVPVMVGDADRAVRAADRLRRGGYWTVAVRPPTVPPSTARLRLSLSAAMRWEELAPLPQLLAKILAS